MSDKQRERYLKDREMAIRDTLGLERYQAYLAPGIARSTAACSQFSARLRMLDVPEALMLVLLLWSEVRILQNLLALHVCHLVNGHDRLGGRIA